MKKLRITIGNKSYDVTVEVLEDDGSQSPTRTIAPPPSVAKPTSPGSSSSPPAKTSAQPPAGSDETTVICPMAGVVVSVLVKQGDEVEKGQDLVVLEAMKMENKITSPNSATVKSVNVQEGQSVLEGHVLLALE